jgi:hypothetical protein
MGDVEEDDLTQSEKVSQELEAFKFKRKVEQSIDEMISQLENIANLRVSRIAMKKRKYLCQKSNCEIIFK